MHIACMEFKEAKIALATIISIKFYNIKSQKLWNVQMIVTLILIRFQTSLIVYSQKQVVQTEHLEVTDQLLKLLEGILMIFTSWRKIEFVMSIGGVYRIPKVKMLQLPCIKVTTAEK